MKKIFRWLFKKEWLRLEIELRGLEHQHYEEMRALREENEYLRRRVRSSPTNTTNHSK